jgi:arylsulfatase A-like enzyme
MHPVAASPHRRSVWEVLCVWAVAALLQGCGAEPAPTRNVVLLVLDTVRADHLGCYGYARPTTPSLDALAARSDRYAVARSTAPWTLPSHASLFTGKAPQLHGADARRLASGEVLDAMSLRAEELTLAEALRDGGWSTAAFVANGGYVNPRMGLDQGFQEFKMQRLDARSMSEQALGWIDKQAPEKPWFVFVNYMDAHRPYNTAALPPERAAGLPKPPAEGEPNTVEALDALYLHVFTQAAPPPPEMVQRVVDDYDLGLANLDLGLAALFDGLRARGLLDNALVVITADHGEYFGEHDLVEHSKDVYEQALRIPLIVKRPAQHSGRVLEAPISLADVPALVLREAAPEVAHRHAQAFRGTSELLGQVAQARYARRRDLAAEWSPRFQRERDVVYVERFKLIYSSDGQHELYDLTADPGELDNLFSREQARVESLVRWMERLRLAGDNGGVLPRAPSAAELKELAALGYVDELGGAEELKPVKK